MVALWRCNSIIRAASPRLLNIQISAVSLHSDGLLRTSWCSNVAPMGPASTPFTARAAMATSILRSRGGHMAMPPVRGGFIRFQQPWEPRGECHLPGARLMGSLSVVRWFRKIRMRRRSTPNKVPEERELELDVKVGIEDGMPVDEEVLNTAEILRLNVPMAMKVAFDGLKDSNSKTRDPAIDDVGTFEKVELSVLLSTDDFIRKLNKEWRGEDHATDVISMTQHTPGFQLPILMLGDIAISVDMAARQAEERGHSLLDEIRILMVRGLLHLLGYDDEKSEEAKIEMEKAEYIILRNLGWKGKGLMQSTHDSFENFNLSNQLEKQNVNSSGTKDRGVSTNQKKESLRSNRPKFKYLFCDLDGTLLNSKSRITPGTAEALREAISRGVKIMIATGKTRPAAISALELVDLAGEGGVISKFSPGVFLQGLLVYGKQGLEIYNRNLDPDICKEAFLYSLEHQVPLLGFSQDRTVTLFDHPSIDALHTVYFEPKAEVMPSVEHLLSSVNVQKLLFYNTAENVHSILRPHWSLATAGRARVVQALPEMLEILPSGASKGDGVHMLLDHLGANVDEAMAIGDGENDVEMLNLVRWGVAMANGSDKAKSVADAIVTSNDEDGVADAIYRYVF